MMRIVGSFAKIQEIQFLDEDGTDLTKRLGVAWGGVIRLGTRGEPGLEADLTIFLDRIDIETPVRWQTRNPVTGEHDAVAAIVFRDGSRVDFASDGTPKLTPPPEKTA